MINRKKIGFFANVVLAVVVSSCGLKSKDDRISEIKFMYPKTEIVEVSTSVSNGWKFVANDTTNNRMIFIDAYADKMEQKSFRFNYR